MHFPIMGGGLFRRTVGYVQAVSGVSLHLDAGETLGVVGRVRVRQVDHRAGDPAAAPADVRVGAVRGRELTTLSTSELRPVRRDLQIVFQDPYASLNPKMPVNDIVAEPLQIHGQCAARGGLDRVAELLRAGRA